MAYLNGLLYRLGNGLDGLLVGYLLGGLHVAHNKSEEPEEDEEDCQTEEDNAHCQQGDAEAVRVFTLELGILCLIGLDEVLNARCYVLRGFHHPFLTIASIALVGPESRYADGVNEFDSIAVVECNPYGLRHVDSHREV